MSNPTIKDVATEAGVSIATVSRVLNKSARVNEDMTTRVNNAIQKLGYFPNSIARTLKNDSSRTIGFIVSDIGNTFFTTMGRAVEDVLNTNGYTVFMCSTDDDKEREKRYLSLLSEKKVDGIIINTSGKNDELITRLSHQLPIALFSRRIHTSAFKGDLVDNDNVSGMIDLTKHLLSLGHKKIGLINGQSYVSSAEERLSGFRSAMQGAGIVVDDNYPYLYQGHFNRPSTSAEGTKLLIEKGASAIIYANNQLAYGGLSYCREHGITIPDHLSICCFGIPENYDLLFAQPTCVDQSATAMGTRLADLIIERIESKNEIANREVRFTTNIVLGNGTKAL